MLKAKDVFKVWRASGNLRIDLPLMKAINERHKKETGNNNKNYYDDVLTEAEKADYDARRR